jgi:hypothetical protein
MNTKALSERSGGPAAAISSTAAVRTDPRLGPIISALSELKIYLERRTLELNAEVRAYPTPIARCDDQLPKLLEQRSRAHQQLGLTTGADGADSDVGSDRWAEACRQVLASPMVIEDDETEGAIRARLRAALSACAA